MIKYTDDKKLILMKNFNKYKINGGEEPTTFKEYVMRESENDPNFFGWLFDNGDIESYAALADEQKQEYKNFLDSLSDASQSDQSPLEELASFNKDETSLYFKEKDLKKNGFDMLDITEAYPEYDFVEREADGRLVFHLSEENK